MRKWLRNIRRIRVKRVDATNISDKVVVVNLYITQSLLLFIGMTILLFQSQNLLDMLKVADSRLFVWSLLFSGIAVLANLAFTPFVPKQLQEADAMNILLAKRVPLWHLMIICLVVGFVEELLFRGVIQYAIGIYWTSIVFTIIHVHYLRHWILTGMVFLLSYSLGWLYDHTGSLMVSVVAHALYDLIMLCIVRYDIGGSYGEQRERDT